MAVEIFRCSMPIDRTVGNERNQPARPMKEGAIVGVVTIGLLVLLVGIVASGFEDAGPISMARHFPLSANDLDRAVTLGHNYRLCQLEFIHRNKAQYTSAPVLIDTSRAVCNAKLNAAVDFLISKDYSGDVIMREVKYIRDEEDASTQKLVAALYQGRE